MLHFLIRPGLFTHAILDPIILSDGEYMGAESKTDYSDLNIDLRAKSDSNSPHVTNSDLADSDGFGSGTTHTSGRLAVDDLDDSNKNNNCIVNDTQLRLSTDRPESASPSYRSVTHQVSKL